MEKVFVGNGGTHQACQRPAALKNVKVRLVMRVSELLGICALILYPFAFTRKGASLNT